MKTVLHRNIIFGVIGALVAWFISEPWSDNYSYGRDMFIMISLGFFIWFFLSTANYLYYRRFNLLKQNSRRLLYGIIPIIGAIVVKIILTPSAQTVNYEPDSTTEARVILMDVSSSMLGDRILHLKKAVVNYLNLLEKSNSQDYICLVVFSDDARTISNFTNNYQLLSSVVNSLSTDGRTNMSSGLQLSVDNLRSFLSKSSYKGEIILVSDGDPNSESDVRAVVAHMPYACTTIGAGYNYNASLLQHVSNTTGGVFYKANDINKLTNVFAEIARGSIVGVNPSGENIPLWHRLAGWGLLGLVIGLGVGLFENRKEKIIIGSIGGTIGGIVGAFFLLLISFIGLPGSFGRMLSFVVFAIILAVSFWLTERLYTLINPLSSNRAFPTQR